MTVQLKEVYQPEVEQKMRNVYDSLSEKDRRRYAAAEVVKLGYGGVAYVATLRVLNMAYGNSISFPMIPSGSASDDLVLAGPPSRSNNPKSSNTFSRSSSIERRAIPCEKRSLGPTSRPAISPVISTRNSIL